MRFLVSLMVAALLGGGAHGAGTAETADDAGSAGRNGLIAFASKRAENSYPQIYSVTESGAGRRLFGRTPAVASTAPIPSPDGRRIAYLAGSTIYVARIDGSGRRRIGFGGDLSWAPDSRRLAFSWTNARIPGTGPTVHVATVVSGPLRRRVAEGSNPSWSPDGRRLAISRSQPEELEPSITIVRATDGALVRRLSVRGQATWAPKGGRIAVLGGEGLMVIDESGRILGRPRVVGPLAFAPAWSPDGRRLALVDSGRVVLSRFDGSGRRVVARTTFEDIGSPAWSPDGARLAFANRSDIYTVRGDGKGLRRVTHEPRGTKIVSAPGWTRSGRIVYASMLASNDYDLYTMRADGSRVRRLTWSSLSELAPVWSPDGTRILFTRRSKLFVLDILSGRLRRLAVRGVRYQQAPSWSPDGSRIAFVGTRTGISQGIYTVASTGGAARRIVRGGWAYAPHWSPDGKLIAFGRLGTLYVVRPDGTNMRKVAEPPAGPVGGGPCFYLLDTVSWAHENQLAFVYHGECQGNYTPFELTIQIVGLDGTPVRAIRAHSTGTLTWSPDDRWLVQSGEYSETYFGGYEQDGEIARMRNDGTQLAELTRNRSGIDPDWQPVCDLRGTAGGNRVAGTAADELLCGLAGGDTLVGGTGSDRLVGGHGPDRLLARDGEFDVVGCGPGRDTVFADRRDLVGRDCERVVRR